MIWAQAAVVATAFALLFWRETRKPLRGRVERRLVHTARNVTVGIIGAAAVHLAETPVILPVARVVEARGLGLIPLLPLPGWVSVILACVLMDYTLYLWHVLTHKVPWLWRFHVVHHADLDLDASTAIRFHFGELLISIPWRVAQIVLIGTGPGPLMIWQTATLVSILFHHSNAELPLPLERALSRVIVTPRMHGIHHSIAESEVNSNWSSGLAFWDRLHRTFRFDVPQSRIIVGVPGYQSAQAVSLPRMLSAPFTPGNAAHAGDVDRL
jgi:sterol desaturase/sphingolipid hydroxylase (fatty acid hydroxylase superfamily)